VELEGQQPRKRAAVRQEANDRFATLAEILDARDESLRVGSRRRPAEAKEAPVQDVIVAAGPRTRSRA
jgi:hypothetical protein